MQYGGIETISLTEHHKLDLLAGGLPCPPFSVAGKQLGKDDERDLSSDELYEASGGAVEYSRRLRELRNQEG